MKTALKALLLAVPLALLGYSKTALVPATDTKSLFVRGVLFAALALASVVFFSNAQFRSETVAKLRSFWQHPIGKAVAASFVILGISTIFAFDKYIAFFGNAERGEGFVGLSFMYLFCLLAALVFEKRDWLYFWGVTAATGIIVFVGEMSQFFGGAYRPGSLMDNPIFLAGYFLAIIYAGLLLVKETKEGGSAGYAWLGGTSIACAVIGIFVTETRGVIAGMVAGVVVSLLYVAWKGKQKKIAVGVLVAIALVGGTFVATRHASVWEHVPGFNRIAAFTLADATTQSRLANVTLTLHAVEPTKSNIKNTLIGWGWDNYIFAWEAHYDPRVYVFDKAVFDRAHDKLLDVLVMNGSIGLLAYLALWFFMFRAAFQIGKQSLIGGASILFFATAFFVQDLFVFDTIITYIPFYAVVAYLAFETKRS